MRPLAAQVTPGSFARLVAAALAWLALGACASTTADPAVARALADAEGRAAVVLDANGAIRRWHVELEPAATPVEVRRLVEFVQPGGDVRVDLVLNADGTRHYFATTTDDDTGSPRTVLATIDGVVVERSHTIPWSEVPPDVRAELVHAADPEPRSVSYVVGDDEDDAHYRANFATTIVSWWPADSTRRVERVIRTAEVVVALP